MPGLGEPTGFPGAGGSGDGDGGKRSVASSGRNEAAARMGIPVRDGKDVPWAEQVRIGQRTWNENVAYHGHNQDGKDSTQVNGYQIALKTSGVADMAPAEVKARPGFVDNAAGSHFFTQDMGEAWKYAVNVNKEFVNEAKACIDEGRYQDLDGLDFGKTPVVSMVMGVQDIAVQNPQLPRATGTFQTPDFSNAHAVEPKSSRTCRTAPIFQQKLLEKGLRLTMPEVITLHKTVQPDSPKLEFLRQLDLMN